MPRTGRVTRHDTCTRVACSTAARRYINQRNPVASPAIAGGVIAAAGIGCGGSLEEASTSQCSFCDEDHKLDHRQDRNKKRDRSPVNRTALKR